ncbi:SpoIIIAH-like family protein [Bacillus sp. DJP31]|uniref:SpoIIIAH-like family protein n=1 Tax=Bacillus sp. DJP31 TaxID=3409789 RepID=UPI003BB5C988
MLLKKQTVWLLTMLSLVVVLSVYYVTSPPENKGDDLAFVEDKETTTEEKAEGTSAEDGTESTGTETQEEGTDSTSTEGEVVLEDSTEDAEGGAVISSISSDELFAAIRLEMDASRSEQVESLTTMMNSTGVSAEQKSDAFTTIKELREVSSKEKVLETFIKALSSNYEDVLVRADGEKVTVTVKAEKLSPAEANKIIQKVRTELGQKQVAVEFSK